MNELNENWFLQLEGTTYADCFYWGNNFNDLLSGMNVAFNLLVVNVRDTINATV